MKIYKPMFFLLFFTFACWVGSPVMAQNSVGHGIEQEASPDGVKMTKPLRINDRTKPLRIKDDRGWGHQRRLRRPFPPPPPKPTADEWKADIQAYSNAIYQGDYTAAKQLISKWIKYANDDFDSYKEVTGFPGTKLSGLAMLNQTLANIRMEEIYGQVSAKTWSRDAAGFSKAFVDRDFDRCQSIISKWQGYARGHWAEVQKATGWKGSQDQFLAALDKQSAVVKTASTTPDPKRVAELKDLAAKDFDLYNSFMAKGVFGEAEAIAAKWKDLAGKEWDAVKAALGGSWTKEGFLAYVTKLNADAANAKANGDVSRDSWARDCELYAKALAAGQYADARAMAAKWEAVCETNKTANAIVREAIGGKTEPMDFFAKAKTDLDRMETESKAITKDSIEADLRSFKQAASLGDVIQAAGVALKLRNLLSSYGWKFTELGRDLREFGLVLDQMDRTVEDLKTVQAAAIASAAANASAEQSLGATETVLGTEPGTGTETQSGITVQTNPVENASATKFGED